MSENKKKRLLSVDGGGIKCMIGVEVLDSIEKRLQQEHQSPDYRLRDHFDLIAGTSGGAILACGISLGYSLSEIRTFVSDNARNLFKPAAFYRRYRSVFDETLLERNIQKWFGIDTELGSGRIKGTLLLPMHNMSTDTPWLVSNNPQAKYNDAAMDDSNLSIPLWKLARASSAAPAYYKPVEIEFGKSNRYTQLFSDGAMTGLMNPAFKAFQYSTTSSYGLNWATGEQSMQVLSIGSGTVKQIRPNLKIRETNVINSVLGMPDTMIQASIREQDILCRTFGRCIYGNKMDPELDDMSTTDTAIKDRLFTYSRVSPDISVEGLSRLGLDHIAVDDVFKIDCVDALDQLLEIGAAEAKKITVDSYI